LGSLKLLRCVILSPLIVVICSIFIPLSFRRPEAVRY
jgi:hypothetical protein